MALLSALFGSVIGALATNYFSGKRQQKQNQVALTLKIYEEQSSPEMIQLYMDVASLLERCFENNPPLSYEQIKDTNCSGEYIKLHKLLHFIERIALLFDKGYLDEKLFKLTLSHSFWYNYEKYLSRLIEICRERQEPERHWVKPIEKLASKLRSLGDDPETHHIKLRMQSPRVSFSYRS